MLGWAASGLLFRVSPGCPASGFRSLRGGLRGSIVVEKQRILRRVRCGDAATRLQAQAREHGASNPGGGGSEWMELYLLFSGTPSASRNRTASARWAAAGATRCARCPWTASRARTASKSRVPPPSRRWWEATGAGSGPETAASPGARTSRSACTDGPTWCTWAPW